MSTSGHTRTDSPAGILRHPSALLPKRHILFLSHMRAYSSLLGHIFGSHPQICGYYEMHIGYHSWKSLLRQRLQYFRDEQPKPGFRYMFDKVLHNDHEVRAPVLNHRRVSAVFGLRPPEQTIPSILKLYRDNEPEHEFADPGFAADYYTARVSEIGRLAGLSESGYFYLDVENVKREPQLTLDALSEWLQLQPPLSPDYQLQKKTSQERYGDTSSRLRSGQIEQRGSDYDSDEIDAAKLSRARSTYEQVRARLIEESAAHSIIRTEGAAAATETTR